MLDVVEVSGEDLSELRACHRHHPRIHNIGRSRATEKKSDRPSEVVVQWNDRQALKCASQPGIPRSTPHLGHNRRRNDHGLPESDAFVDVHEHRPVATVNGDEDTAIDD